MASKESSSSASDVRAAENRGFLFEIDLNEIPSSPSSDNVSSPSREAYQVVRHILGNPKPAPGPPAELPGEFRNGSCVCGRVEARGGVVVCDGCERWFHISCAGMRSRQAIVLEDWACGACVKDGVGSKRWPLGFVGSLGSKGSAVRLLDINALPPSDGEGEASDDSQCQRMYASDENQSSSSLVNSVSWNGRNGFDLQRESSLMTDPVKSGLEGVKQQKLTMSRSFEEADLGSHVGGILRGNANTKLRRKELARLSRVNSSVEKQEVYRGRHGGGSKEVTLEPATCIVGVNAGIAEAGSESYTGSRCHQPNDVLPAQLGDFFVLRLGEVDLRPSYHNRNQICPVGYHSSWHDKVSGSIFTCDVLDGGDSGPLFKVRRVPCSNGSALRLTPGVLEANNKVECDFVITSDICYNEDDGIQMHLSDPDPQGQDLLSCLGSDMNASYNVKNIPSQSSTLSGLPSELLDEGIRSSDDIGEFLVEGRSSFLVWEEISEKLVGTCGEVFNKSGSLSFQCKHDQHEMYSGLLNNDADLTQGSLARFCSSSGPTGIPHIIKTVNELDTSCKALAEWLRPDRFGLDVEFVQELVEQLPGANSCSGYDFLSKRREHPTSRIAGSGFLLTKRKGEVQGEEDVAADNLHKGFKRPRIQTPKMDVHYRPPGKPLSTKLSAELASDIVQVWEFLWRFYEILGLKEPLSLTELEEELVSPWSDGSNFLEKIEKELQENKTYTSQRKDNTIDLSLPPRRESDTDVPIDNLPTYLTVETGSGKEASQARLASRTYYKCTGMSLTKVHSSLLNVLVGELQAKVAPLVDPNFDTGDSKPRRGRKKDIDNSIPMKMSKINMLPANELTWPELARRYILSVLSMESNLESSDVTTREAGKVFRCLQGDGGVLCGSLTGVAGMEADALLLAEATKQICGSLKREEDIWPVMEEKDTDVTGTSETADANGSGIPDWAQVLEPVRKLPTNVGTRIRKCVYEALARDPPEWARKILEHSISKEVYKGNASGPTKKAVLSVLADVSSQGPPPKPDKGRKGKGAKTISDIIASQCRKVLRCAAATDESRTFCNLLGTTSLDLNDNDEEGLLGSPAMFSRPLDFRTIDLRLAVGYYGGSHEAFLEDVREVWRNIHSAYGDRPELIQLAETLSRNFESLYEKEVLTLVQKCREFSNSESSSSVMEKELIGVLNCADGIPKAPWDEGVCKVCGIDKDDESVLLCDTCDSEYHTYCLVPPLARIPEGNWYCPSCVAGQGKAQDSSKYTRVLTRRRQKKYQGEDSRYFSEALNRLALTMGEKEYWEFSVEERIFLLKFLCDEVLNSAIIREHFDKCAELSSDLQQKLRSLAVELRSLKFREETLATRSTKENVISFDGVSEAGREKMPTVLTNHGKCVGQRQILNNKYSCQITPTGNLIKTQDVPNESEHPDLHTFKPASEKHCNGGGDEHTKLAAVGDETRDQTCVTDNSPVTEHTSSATSRRRDDSNGQILQPLSSKDSNFEDVGRELNIQSHLNKKNGLDIGTNGPSAPHEIQGSLLSADTRQENFDVNGTAETMNFDNLFLGNHSNTQINFNESAAPNLEVNSLKKEISLLMESIASIELQLLKVSMRRDLLGRDSAGRLYWVLYRPEKSPWLFVDGSLTAQQAGRGCERKDSVLENLSERCSTPLCSETSSTPGVTAACNSDGNRPQNGPFHGVRVLPSCVFYDSDIEIQELILWLRDSDPRDRDLTESILQFYKLRQAGNIVHVDPRAKSSNDDARGAPRSLFTKAVGILEKSYGPCLEAETTEAPKKRGRKMKVVHEDRLYRCECLEPIWPSRHHCLSCHQTFCTSLELEGHNDGKCNSSTSAPDDSKEIDDSSKGKSMTRSEASRGCTKETETIEALRSEKFDVSSRLTKFQKGDVGCPYNFEEISRRFITNDSNKELAREIGLLDSNGIPSFVPTVSPYIHDPTLTLDPAQRALTAVGVTATPMEVDSSHPNQNETSNSSPRRVNGLDCVPGKSTIFSLCPELDGGDCGIVPVSALRPLVGKSSQILRRLKINLLDIEAALPEEALRPTKSHSSNRRSWRAYIKSAESILEMIKAVIVFEDMIKTEYLKNWWWYWSSLSAAARTSTVSSLSLRVYALDSALIYESNASHHSTDRKRKGTEG